MSFFENVPWFLPGVLVAIVLGVVMQRPVARALAMSPRNAASLVVCIGLVVAATLTPLRLALESGVAGSGRCDLSRLGLPSFDEISRLGASDIAPNVLLFIPLGFVIGSSHRSWQKMSLILAAIAAPVLIEVTQMVVPVLGRGCESADVVDNLLGLTLGLLLAAVRRSPTTTASPRYDS
jgi:glycopeptide antibiotics resistance protein